MARVAQPLCMPLPWGKRSGSLPGSAGNSSQDNKKKQKGAKKMTAREKAQLERLLQKKEQEEAEEKAFFTQVKRQRKKVIHVLGLEEAVTAHEFLKTKAAESGVSVTELLAALPKVPDSWIYKQTHETE